MGSKPHIFMDSDGALFIEWIEDGGRFGICEEPNEPEDGWYFVTNTGISSSGPFPKEWVDWDLVRAALSAGAE